MRPGRPSVVSWRGRETRAERVRRETRAERVPRVEPGGPGLYDSAGGGNLRVAPLIVACEVLAEKAVAMSGDTSVLAKLTAVIEARKRERPPGSYTAELLGGGVDAIGAKLCEEAAELVEAARLTEEDREPAVIHEAADLVYHLLVMLGWCDVAMAEVEAELARRFGVSGLEEKASRRGGGDV